MEKESWKREVHLRKALAIVMFFWLMEGALPGFLQPLCFLCFYYFLLGHDEIFCLKILSEHAA